MSTNLKLFRNSEKYGVHHLFIKLFTCSFLLENFFRSFTTSYACWCCLSSNYGQSSKKCFLCSHLSNLLAHLRSSDLTSLALLGHFIYCSSANFVFFSLSNQRFRLYRVSKLILYQAKFLIASIMNFKSMKIQIDNCAFYKSEIYFLRFTVKLGRIKIKLKKFRQSVCSYLRLLKVSGHDRYFI